MNIKNNNNMPNESVNYWLENKESLLKEYKRREAKYTKTLDLFKKNLESITLSRNTSFVIKGRIKNFEKFHGKLLKKSIKQEIESPFEFITDLMGIRIVVPFLEDLHEIEKQIRKNFGILEVRYKHKELSIREFGYDSTHLIIEVPREILNRVKLKDHLVCEIQLRTILQDAWAEVEHELVYKASIDKVEDTIRRKLIALNATLSLADTTFQEIRDYQGKRFNELQERHNKLLDKVSTIPEKMGKMHENPLKPSAPENLGKQPEMVNIDSEMNDLFLEALNAHMSNNLEKALKLYTHLILVSPNHYIYNHRGLVYFSLSQYENAMDDFTKAIEIEPNDTRVYTNRGLTYRMLKNYERALEDFNRSLELNPLWPDTFYGRSLTYYDLGDIRSAIEDCDRAITLKPDFKQAVRFKQFLLRQEKA